MNLDESIGFRINHTGRKITQLLNHHFSHYDITIEQWVVLNRLADQDGITQKELAHRVEKDPTNTTRILDQLEKKGWIERRPNAMDRRSFLTFLTKEGRALNEIITPLENEVLKSVLEGLADEQVKQLKLTLNQITDNINRRLRME